MRKDKFNSNTGFEELLMFDEDLEVIAENFYDDDKMKKKKIGQTVDEKKSLKTMPRWSQSQSEGLEKIMESQNDDTEYVESSDESEENTFYTMNDAATDTYASKSTLSLILNKYNSAFPHPNLSDNNLRFSGVTSQVKKPYEHHICCVKNFSENQILKFRPNYRLEFMDEKFPFSNATISELKKKCCSFLNADGGIIYFGIENVGPNYYVKHQIYSEQDKEDVLKAFRDIFDRIEPDITIKRKYKVEFVPVQKNKKPSFIEGAFIIRIKVSYGVRDELYCYTENEIDYFPFRSEEGIVMKQGMKLLKIQREILKNPFLIPEPIHEGLCENPDIGELLFQTKITKKTNKERETKENDLSDEYVNISSLTRVKEHKKNFGINQGFEQKNSYQDGLSEKENKMVDEFQQETPEKEKEANAFESYFFAEGLDEKDLEPLLKKYNLYENVLIEEYCQKKIIIKVKAEVVKSAKNLFNKLEKKYKDKIIITEMSLKLRVNHNVLREVVECLQGINLKYQFQGSNILKFEKMLESFQAFVLTKNYSKNMEFLMN